MSSWLLVSDVKLVQQCYSWSCFSWEWISDFWRKKNSFTNSPVLQIPAQLIASKSKLNIVLERIRKLDRSQQVLAWISQFCSVPVALNAKLNALINTILRYTCYEIPHSCCERGFQAILNLWSPPFPHCQFRNIIKMASIFVLSLPMGK